MQVDQHTLLVVVTKAAIAARWSSKLGKWRFGLQRECEKLHTSWIDESWFAGV